MDNAPSISGTKHLATHHVPRSSFARLVSELAAADRLDMWAVDGIVGGHAAAPEKGGLAVYREEIDRLFGGDDLDAVVAAVQEAEPGPGWIANANSALRHASPTSLRATWRRMVESATHPIERVLADDYRMAVRIVGGHDFAEGVRAVLVDKDRSARWSPETLGQVGTGAVDALLADLPGTPDFATGGRAE